MSFIADKGQTAGKPSFALTEAGARTAHAGASNNKMFRHHKSSSAMKT